jgi:hypothetical protein
MASLLAKNTEAKNLFEYAERRVPCPNPDKSGMTIINKMPMIATTNMNSIKVKPAH